MDPSFKWYAYKAYFENHLSYSSSNKNNILSFKGYLNDKVDKFNDVGVKSKDEASNNKGFLKRK